MLRTKNWMRRRSATLRRWGNHDYDANNPATRTSATVNFKSLLWPIALPEHDLLEHALLARKLSEAAAMKNFLWFRKYQWPTVFDHGA